MKRKTSALVLAILTTISSFAGIMAYYRPVQAVGNDDTLRLLKMVSQKTGDNLTVVLDPNTNTLGTHDYAMVGTSRPHKSKNVFTTFGLEISKTQKEDGNNYVDTFASQYEAYNKAWSGKGNESGDPHYYNGNERISFVLSRFYTSSDKYGSGRSISENRIDYSSSLAKNLWVIGEGLVHDGIAQSGDSEWLSDYEAWGQREDANESRFSFGFDTVNAATYGGEYVDYYQVFPGNTHLYDKNANDVTASMGDATQLDRANGRYNYRRKDYQWGYANGVAGHDGGNQTQWDAYKTAIFLEKDHYDSKGSPAMTWKNYFTDGTFGVSGFVCGNYKRYYCSDFQKLPDPDPGTSTSKIITLTKNVGTTSNIATGTYSGDTISGDMYSAPEVYTWNNDASGKFDIGTAIPTTESYTNYVEEDQWYGHTTIEAVDASVNLKGNYKIHWTAAETYHYEEKVTKIVTIGGVKKEIESYINKTETKYVPKTSHYQAAYTWNTSDYGKTFYRITDVNLFELESAYTKNESVGYTSYGENIFNVHVPYNVAINGVSSNDTNRAVIAIGPSYTTLADWVSKTQYAAWGALGSPADISKQTYEVTLQGSYSVEPTEQIINLAQGDFNKRMNRADLVNTTNDHFEIAGYTYLDASGIHGAQMHQVQHEMNETSATYEKVNAESLKTIGEKIQNGKYFTEHGITYHKIVTSMDKRNLRVSDIDNASFEGLNRLAIKPESAWLHNEPVIVFSPVMSPIHVEGDDYTQLVDQVGASYGVAQVRLDGTYKLRFDWNSYFHDMYGWNTDAGYTNYISDKYLSFPFSVRVNGKYYEPNTNDTGAGVGYTDWISVGRSTTEVDVYIPSWAKEGLYGAQLSGATSFFDANTKPVKVRVESNNVPDAMKLDGTAHTEDTHNTNPNNHDQLESDTRTSANYISTFDYPIQVSGWLYNLKIDSVYDSTNFAPYNWEDEWGYDVYSFVHEATKTSHKEAEKRAGVFNRLGPKVGVSVYDRLNRQNVRFTADGIMTDSWADYNTMAMAAGKNPFGSNLGHLVRGNTIGFTLKTIANLAGDNDSIEITPSFRYYHENGTEVPDVDIWYEYAGNLIKMGSSEDITRMKTVELFGNAFFDDDYYDYFYNTTKQTAFYTYKSEKDTNPVVLSKEEDCYSVGKIKLTKNVRLITGNEEELASNLTSVNDALTTTTRYVVGGTSGAAGSNSGEWNITKKEYGYVTGDGNYTGLDGDYDFKKSMQTWYGQYWIPNDIHICPHNAVEDYLGDPSNPGMITYDEDFWLGDNEEGYLVLNFDIETLKDGHEHLEYYGDTTPGMWGNENGEDPTGPVTPDTNHVHDDGNDNPNIPTYPGDVAIISLKDSVKAHWGNGLLYLN